MIFFRTLAPFILGLFGIREFTKDDGVIDRAVESPIGNIGYIAIVVVLFVAIYNGVKDLKLFK